MIFFIYFIFTAHNNKLHNILDFDEHEKGQKEENNIITVNTWNIKINSKNF